MYTTSHKPGVCTCSFEYFVHTLLVKMAAIYSVLFGLIILCKLFHFYKTKGLPIDFLV